MTTSRDTILTSVRRNRPAEAEPPALECDWTTCADRLQQFTDVLQVVGGRTIVVDNHATLLVQLQALPEFSGAKVIASCLPDIVAGNVGVNSITDPHELANVDIAILPGEFAVAENAAVWVTDRNVPLRALYFLCQHLVLIVPAVEIVDHMHAAYARLANDVFTRPVFGTFISGPSKTADIEQSLVIGAHGPRSLTVCFLK